MTITGTEGVNIYASRVSAGQSVNLTGGQVTVMSGVNDSQTSIATQSDSHSLTPNTLPHSLVSGINARSNETNTLEQTTLAGATLSGSKVNITATTGDVNLIAPTINAIQGVTLNATKGAVNFDVVNTTTEVSQDKGGKSLMYQRTSDSGVHTEAANYTQINSPNLTVDASQVNVRVGVPGTIVPGGSGLPTQFVPTQTLQQGLSQMINSGQPGMSWVTQLQTSHSLDDKINWQGVPVGQRAWAEGQGSLTQTGAAVVTIVATVLTWGYGAEFAGYAAGSTEAGAAAANAGLSALAGHAAVSLINNNGDIGATLHDLGSSRTILDIVTAMATAGAVQGLNIGLGMQGYTAANAVAGSATWGQVLGRNLLDGVAGGLVYSAINGTSAEDAIRNGLLNGLLNTGAAASAQWIGGNTQGFANAFAHAVAGCLAGAGRASAGGGGVSAGDGCSTGAIGATVGHLAGDLYNPTGNPDLAQQTIQFGKMMAGIAGALVGGNQASADIAAAAGANAVENNTLGQMARAVGATCAKFPALCVGTAGAAALQAQISQRVSELQRDNPGLSTSGALDVVQSEIVARAVVNAWTSFVSSIPSAADYGSGGYGAGGMPNYGPPNTGNSNRPPYFNSNTGGAPINYLHNYDISSGGYGVGVLPSYGASTWTPNSGLDGPSIMMSNGPNQYHEQPSDSNHIYGELKPNGVLDYSIEAGPGAQIRGGQLFADMMNHFGDNVKAIGGNWYGGTNLGAVNSLTAEGVPLEQAVTRTWASAQASKYEFNNVEIVKQIGGPGNYTSVEVIYKK